MKIRPINYATNNSMKQFFFLSLGEMGTVAGWGRLSEGGQLPSILQYVRYFTCQYKTAIVV